MKLTKRTAAIPFRPKFYNEKWCDDKKTHHISACRTKSNNKLKLQQTRDEKKRDDTVVDTLPFISIIFVALYLGYFARCAKCILQWNRTYSNKIHTFFFLLLLLFPNVLSNGKKLPMENGTHTIYLAKICCCFFLDFTQ